MAKLATTTRRLFFALWPAVDTRGALARLRERLPDQCRPIHPEDLHLTLVFLGPVTEDRHRCAESAAERIAARGFELVIDGMGSFARSRVIWCGSEQSPPELIRLVTALQTNLESCGFARESRAFAPHVTLARKARPIQAAPLARPIIWPVDAFVLVESTGNASPPRYRVLRRWPFARG